MESENAYSKETTLESENPYSDWTKKALKEGIAEVKAKVSALEGEVTESREEKRQKKIANVKAGIEAVKAKLKALGAEPLDPPTKKRKRMARKEDGHAKAGKGKKGKKGKGRRKEE